MLAKYVLYTSVTCYNCACEDHDLWRGPYNNIQQCTQVKINKMVIRIPLLYLVEELTYDSFNMHWKQVFKLLSLHFNYSSPASLSLKLLWPVSHVLVPSLAFSQKKKVNIFGKFRFEEKIKNNKVPNRCSGLFKNLVRSRTMRLSSKTRRFVSPRASSAKTKLPRYWIKLAKK